MRTFTEQALRRVFFAIPEGRECAVHQSELSKRLGLTPQALKDAVRQLRTEYGAVFSSQCGYWRSESREEFEEFIRFQQAQARSRLATLNRMKRHWEAFEGQQSLKF